MISYPSPCDSVARIRRRIRSRILCNWPFKVFVLCLLVCLVGFELQDNLSLAVAFGVEGAAAQSTGKEDGDLPSSRKRKGKTKNKTGPERPMTMNRILIKAGKRGLGGGLPGAIAGVVQVLTLMWVR
jgi:hypothetical protein